jgi:N-acetylmuramoyl-L-alanine amidase
MNYLEVVETERKIRNDGYNGAFIIELPALVPIKGDASLKMQVIKVTPEHRNLNFFYTSVYPKTQIVLHFTEGHLRGDLSQLTKENQHVSVPFVVARDGGIYRLFGSECWAFHIGRNPIGSTNEELSRSTIAIELSNYGPLRLKGNDLITNYDDVYCSLDDTAQYIKLDTPYRGFSYYTKHTDEQYDGLIILLRYLTAQFGIPRAFLPEAVRHLATTQAIGFKGIVSHVNYRSDKNDIGPAFNWARVINGVTDPTYTPMTTRNIGTRGLGGPSEVANEKALDGTTFFRKRKTDFKPGDVEPDF